MLRHWSPDPKRSAITTRKPSSARSRTICDPMNPAPPVTTIRSSLDKFCTADMIDPFGAAFARHTAEKTRSSARWLSYTKRLLGCRVLYDDTGDHRSG